jgi:probable blue pigment (indigoidine) exporter
MKKFPLFDTALTALAPAIWGSTYVIVTEVLPAGRPFTAAAVRALPAGLLLVLFAGRMLPRHLWWRVAVLAALNIGAFQALLFVAAYRLPGGLAAVLGAIQPIVIMGLAWGWEGRRPQLVAMLAAVAGVAGMAALLLSPSARWDAVGVTAALVGALSMAVGNWLARRWKTGLPVIELAGWQLLLGGLMLAPLALLVDPPLPSSLALSEVLGYGYLCLVGALLAYLLWFRGLTRLSPVAVSSLGLLSPATAVLLGWALLGQRLGATALAGLAVVLGSVLTLQLKMQEAK